MNKLTQAIRKKCPSKDKKNSREIGQKFDLLRMKKEIS
jgi:hypothetical protein